MTDLFPQYYPTPFHQTGLCLVLLHHPMCPLRWCLCRFVQPCSQGGPRQAELAIWTTNKFMTADHCTQNHARNQCSVWGNTSATWSFSLHSSPSCYCRLFKKWQLEMQLLHKWGLRQKKCVKTLEIWNQTEKSCSFYPLRFTSSNSVSATVYTMSIKEHDPDTGWASVLFLT